MLDGTTAKAYTDFSQFAEMRLKAQQAPEDSLPAVAKQFEGIFVNMMLKSMREASFGDPLFDSDQSKLYQEMFDKQLSQDMTRGKGIGLADALVIQMQKYVPHNSKAASDVSAIEKPIQDPFVLDRNITDFKNTEQFVTTMLPYAESAAQKLGVDPKILVAQSALETGWGKSVGKLANGKSSYNLFNIKAGDAYNGNKFNKQTVEYSGGLAKVEKASFRAYNNYQESFDDYVNLIKNTPRYQEALNDASDATHYIEGIQRAGYATDPLYAEKVSRVFSAMPVTHEASNDETV